MCSIPPIPIRSAHSKTHIVMQATKFIVASKSGTTLEPNILKDYFWDRAKAADRKAPPGEQFIAVTDPGIGARETREG